jgi:integrase
MVRKSDPRFRPGFIDPDRFDAEVWKPIATRAGMPGTRFHDLRHFFASQLIANGETAAFVRDQMGHSSIKVTFDTYGHLCPGKGQEASERYEKAMQAARTKSEPDVSNGRGRKVERNRNWFLIKDGGRP